MRQSDNEQMPKKITEELRQAIRDEFIHGYTNDEGQLVYPTIDALVKKHEVARATLYRWVEKEDWQADKNRYQTELEMRLDSERLQRMVDEGKRLDDRSLLIAQGMLQKVARRLQRGFQDEQENPRTGGIPVDQLRELSQIAMNAQKIGKLALGQAQEISKVSADVSSPEAFREVLEQLDEIAEARSSRYRHTLQ